MNILVTGGAGYLGSVLLPKLLGRGHKLRVLDIGYFGIGHLRAMQPSIQLVREDLRKIALNPDLCNEAIEGCDCIIHLAALSNDQSAELNPEITDEVNTKATYALAEAARKKGIKFIFSSSCAIYGESRGEADEESRLEPISIYAKSKVNAENAILSIANSTWKPVILRNGSLFGYSPRMRFDLVINIFSLYSVLRNELKVFGEGLQWRPFIHVKDVARAIGFFTEKERVNYSCYNIANKNLRVIDLLPVFQEINPNVKITKVKLDKEDNRNYKVSTKRMRDEGFEPSINVDYGAEEIIEAIIGGQIPDPESIYYQNAKWLKELNPNLDPSLVAKMKQ